MNLAGRRGRPSTPAASASAAAVLLPCRRLDVATTRRVVLKVRHVRHAVPSRASPGLTTPRSMLRTPEARCDELAASARLVACGRDLDQVAGGKGCDRTGPPMREALRDMMMAGLLSLRA